MRQNTSFRIGLVMAAAAAVAFGFGVSTQTLAAQISTQGPSIGPRAPSISPVAPRIDPHFSRGGTTGYQTQSHTGDGDSKSQIKKPSGPANQSGQQAGGGAVNVPAMNNEVLIEVSGTPTAGQVDALANRHRLTRVESYSLPLTGTTFFRWRISDGRSVNSVLNGLRADSAVLSVQRNFIFKANQSQVSTANPGQISELTAGDPAQYTLAKLHLSRAHGLARGEKVLVAVIDSGIDVTHPELAGVIVDSFDTLSKPEPPHTHGTAIAGAIASHVRLRGVAPSARILAVNAFGATSDSAEGTTMNVLRALDWSVAHGARIINMSFAGPNDPALRRALAIVRQRGIVMIAASGNAGAKSPPLYPAADPNVIAVTATDAQDKLFVAANRGPHIAIAAPGVDILLPAPGAGYQVTSGTSFAAAHVSGVAALILERRPDLSPDQVKKILIATSKDLGPKGRDDLFGAGLADPYKAILSLGTQAVETSATAPAR